MYRIIPEYYGLIGSPVQRTHPFINEEDAAPPPSVVGDPQADQGTHQGDEGGHQGG